MQLTTKHIRSTKGKPAQLLNKKKAKTIRTKLSIEKAKRERESTSKKDRIFETVIDLLSKCGTSFEVLGKEELLQACNKLQTAYETIEWPYRSKSNDDVGSSLSMLDEINDKIVFLKKNQMAFKKKLDKITATLKTVDILKKITLELKKDSLEREAAAAVFRKEYCIKMKSDFDPLFGGKVTTRGHKRRPQQQQRSIGKGLLSTVWDSKTSKQ